MVEAEDGSAELKKPSILDQKRLTEELNRRLGGNTYLSKNAGTYLTGVLESALEEILSRATLHSAARGRHDAINFRDVQAALHHNDALKNTFGKYLAVLEPPTGEIPRRVLQRPMGSSGIFRDNGEGAEEDIKVPEEPRVSEIIYKGRNKKRVESKDEE